MIEQAVAEILLLDAGVQAVVGERIHPLVIPQGERGIAAMPCLVYQVITRERRKTRCGTSALVKTSLQIDAYGRSYAQCKSASETCVAALLDFRGSAAGVSIQDVALGTEIDLIDPEPGLYRVSNTFDIWHTPR